MSINPHDIAVLLGEILKDLAVTDGIAASEIREKVLMMDDEAVDEHLRVSCSGILDIVPHDVMVAAFHELRRSWMH